MRRLATWSLLLALVALLPAIARASTTVMVGNAPAAPVVAFRAEPRMVIVPGTTVYVVHNYEDLDYDYFEYGAWYYIYSHDHWYKAPGYRGPFVVVHEMDVPRVFYGLHDRGYHWKHRPQGQPMARASSEHHGPTVHHATTVHHPTDVHHATDAHHTTGAHHAADVHHTTGSHHAADVHHTATKPASTKVATVEKHGKPPVKHASVHAAPKHPQAHNVTHTDKHPEKHGAKHTRKKHTDKGGAEKSGTESGRD